MKRILFIGHEASRSGAPIVLFHLLRWINRNRPDLEVHLLLLTGGDLESEYRKICTVHVLRKSISDSEANAVAKKAIRYLRKSLGVEGRLLSQLTNSHNVVVGNTAASLEMLNFFKQLGLTTICWMHEMDSALDQFFTRETFSELARTVDKFIAGSNAVRNTLLNRDIEDPIDVVHEFVETTDLPERSNVDIRSELNIPADAFIVGACASIERRKGIDLFGQIAQGSIEKRPNIYFIWVGGRYARTEAAYQEAQVDTEKLGIAARVLFVDPVCDLLDYYRAIDVFLLPSREDPFPLVCLEAASVSKPVLCFENAGGMPEFIEDDAGFVVPHLDVEAMSERIIELHDDVDLRQRLGSRAAAKVRDRHDVSKGASEILKIIEASARDRK
ncbi:MAG: glycosyltransferase family 4 protein [Acidobacteriota bacterium]